MHHIKLNCGGLQANTQKWNQHCQEKNNKYSKFNLMKEKFYLNI